MKHNIIGLIGSAIAGAILLGWFLAFSPLFNH